MIEIKKEFTRYNKYVTVRVMDCEQDFTARNVYNSVQSGIYLPFEEIDLDKLRSDRTYSKRVNERFLNWIMQPRHSKVLIETLRTINGKFAHIYWVKGEMKPFEFIVVNCPEKLDMVEYIPPALRTIDKL